MLSRNRSLQVGLIAAVALIVGTSVLLVGCAPERHEAVPQNARIMSQGTGDVSFTAPSDGMVYVEDVGDHKLVYSGQVRKGQTLELDAREPNSPIKLSGQTVQDKVIRESHDYKIYFDEHGMQNMDHTTIHERDREIERSSSSTDHDRM